jgi:hypothetical protein
MAHFQVNPSQPNQPHRAAPCSKEIVMNTSLESTRYELRFRSLFNEGRAYAFTCNAQGQVDMDSLTSRQLTNYLYARTVIGREFSMPAVLPSPMH